MLLGHQGGWDEATFVIAPLLLFFMVLQVAKRRAEREQRDERGELGDPPEE